MLQAIYIGLSGMNAYSKGLTVVSNNVANLNTPGFKLGMPLFRDLVYQNGGGAGVEVDASHTSFKAGDLRTTGNPYDAAVDGNGFFVIQHDDKYQYTRAGQFEINKDGDLVERNTNSKVMMGLDGSAAGTFNVNEFRTYPPVVTTEVSVSGTLARTGTNTTYQLPNISVIDTSGGRQLLKATFTRDAADPLHWTVDVVDANNVSVGSGDLRMNADGTPATGSNTIAVTVKPANSPEFTTTLNFGEPGSFSGVTSSSGSTQSSLQILKQNGKDLGALTKTEFTEKGELKLTYSNGESKMAGKLLLAQFDTPTQLQSLGNGLFAALGDLQPQLGTGLATGFGRIVGGQLELSNVDLTQQFTDLIILQRGYQAGSQVNSVANEMIQQLLSMSGR